MTAIVFAIPVFLALMMLEFGVSLARGHNAYRLNDAVGSLSLGILSQVVGVFTAGLWIVIYTTAYVQLAAAHWSESDWRIWVIGLVAYDFCYYWLHRAGHEIGIFWAAHVVHHQSEDYNLSTALRQTSSGFLLGWIFYLPLAVIGVPPLVFIGVGLIDLLYQFWVHTEEIGDLGWFDRVFASPSNHRVHHAVNDRYLDKNYGGVFMIWDRLFGTFEEERERCVYGVRSPLHSFNPLWANVAFYWDLARTSRRARRWSDKLKVWIAPPGWRPPDVEAADPKPAFDFAALQRFDPPADVAANLFVSLCLVAMVAATAFFLMDASTMPVANAAVVFAAFLAALWAMGAVLQRRLSTLEAAFVVAAGFACAAYALDFRMAFEIAKPAATALALVAAATRDGPADRRALLLGGLAFSLLGDTILLWPELFAFGLAAFLVAQGLYVALFARGVGFLPARWPLVALGLVSAAVVAFIWTGIDAPLKAPVVIYVSVITVMAGQAAARALVLRDAASIAVAVGAVIFVMSDTTIALVKFAAFGAAFDLSILPTYYLAQGLISFFALPRQAATAA